MSDDEGGAAAAPPPKKEPKKPVDDVYDVRLGSRAGRTGRVLRNGPAEKARQGLQLTVNCSLLLPPLKEARLVLAKKAADAACALILANVSISEQGVSHHGERRGENEASQLRGANPALNRRAAARKS